MPFLFALQVPVKRSYAFEQPEIPHGEQWVLKVCEGCAVVQVARCVYRRQDVYREVASYSKVCTGRCVQAGVYRQIQQDVYRQVASYSKVCTGRCVQAGVYRQVCTGRYSKVCTARCVQAGGKKQQGVYSKVCTSRYSKV